MFTHCESAQISIKANENIELKYLLSSFQIMFAIRLLIMMQLLIKFKTALQFSQIHSSFLTCLFQSNPFLSCFMKENLLRLPQLLYGTMVI
jgi:hypothetical protein